MAKENYTGLDPHQLAFIKAVKEMAHAKRPHEVFRDFCELAALSFSCAVDWIQAEQREERYRQVVASYPATEVRRFSELLGYIVESLGDHMHDALGEIFMAMDLGSHWHGQFFTPYPVAQMMGAMVAPSGPAALPESGFQSVCEPAVGAGAMVIAMADAMLSAKINYQQCMHVFAIDIDPLAVHMAYIQFSLLHIPAVVFHGNTITAEMHSYWLTPAHVLGLWDLRLRKTDTEAAPQPVEAFEIPASQPQTRDAPAVLASARDEVVSRRIEVGAQLGLFD